MPSKKSSTAKPKARLSADIDEAILTESFAQQFHTGKVADAIVSSSALPSLQSAPDRALRLDRCIFSSVTLSDTKARRLSMQDVRIDTSDLAYIDLTGASLDRVEIISTRLTGAAHSEAQLRNVLFKECKLDLAGFRMARLQSCVFERCILTEADFYGATLSGVVFRDCDLSRADISHAMLDGADLRGCRLDGVRGTPATMEGLTIGPDQAALLITLCGVRVIW